MVTAMATTRYPSADAPLKLAVHAGLPGGTIHHELVLRLGSTEANVGIGGEWDPTNIMPFPVRQGLKSAVTGAQL